MSKFVLIGENVLNFHHSDDAYYEEWFDEVMEEDGWIALLNFREHVLADMQAIDLDSYFVLGGELNEMGWRTFTPEQLCAAGWTIVSHTPLRTFGLSLTSLALSVAPSFPRFLGLRQSEIRLLQEIQCLASPSADASWAHACPSRPPIHRRRQTSQVQEVGLRDALR